jgi:2-keto-4-pentenoate hydratase/2-oxohepta-3-ene-1,7-dioic acid hydratase in catechol pathway
MQLVSFSTPAGPRAGVLADGRVFEVRDAPDGGLQALLERGALEGVERTGEGVAIDAVELLPPIGRPSKIICIGLNYRAHAEETGGSVPTQPLTFTKFPSCLAGPRADIPLVPGSVDWEVELVLVVGAGCTVGQDVSERQLQRAGKPPQFSLAKSHRGFGPIGPWVTDEAEPSDLAISCALNGEVVQASRTSDMVFGPDELLAYLGGICELRPGDLVFTGTPAGVGMGRTPPRFLQPGDVLVSTIEHVGTLVNRCR